MIFIPGFDPNPSFWIKFLNPTGKVSESNRASFRIQPEKFPNPPGKVSEYKFPNPPGKVSEYKFPNTPGKVSEDNGLVTKSQLPEYTSFRIQQGKFPNPTGKFPNPPGKVSESTGKSFRIQVSESNPKSFRIQRWPLVQPPTRINGWNLKITQLNRKIHGVKPPWLWVRSPWKFSRVDPWRSNGGILVTDRLNSVYI